MRDRGERHITVLFHGMNKCENIFISNIYINGLIHMYSISSLYVQIRAALFFILVYVCLSYYTITLHFILHLYINDIFYSAFYNKGIMLIPYYSPPPILCFFPLSLIYYIYNYILLFFFKVLTYICISIYIRINILLF